METRTFGRRLMASNNLSTICIEQLTWQRRDNLLDRDETTYLTETRESWALSGLSLWCHEKVRGRSPLSTTHMIRAREPAENPDPSSNMRSSMWGGTAWVVNVKGNDKCQKNNVDCYRFRSHVRHVFISNLVHYW